MKKGSKAVFVLILTISAIFAQSGYWDPSAPISSENYTPYSNFVSPAFPNIPKPLSLLSDTLTTSLGWIKMNFIQHDIEIYIDRNWEYITITEYIEDEIYKIPFTAPVEWYFQQMMDVKRQIVFTEKVNLSIEETQAGSRRGTKGITIDLVDMGALGTASLRVRGNINISGKMVFQDQELVRSSLNDSQNTHLEFDQKQNLNVEGKIGDRITVLMDNDSERDFDWENNIRISYEGKEDDIIQKIDAGNISLSLPATQYVTFSGQNKGLFGLKAVSKLGPVDITTIASIEKTKKEIKEYKGTDEAEGFRLQDYEYIKNKYFFINEMYRNGIENGQTEYKGQQKTISNIPPFYPLNEIGQHFIGRYVIRDFELYRMDNSPDPNTNPGTAFVHIDNPSDDDRENVNFKRLENGQDYSLSNDLGFIRLKNASADQLLACHYFIVEVDPADRNVAVDTVLAVGHGLSGSDSTLALQMIKPENLTPNHDLWDLMFKNVYSLRTQNINEEGFKIVIWNTIMTPDKESDPNGIAYITQFGLDLVDEANTQNSDNIIDKNNPNIVSLANGELFFPMFHPFASDSIEGGNQNPDLKGVLGEGKMYTSTIINEKTEDKHWEIEVTYKNKSTSINLGFMIVEGSDQVFLQGRELKRGTDYQVDYFTGTLVLDPNLDPNAELKILFEKHELVSFDKKTIVGTRAQMDLGKNSFLGATALYYNQSIINEKVEVGYEPMTNFIWDMNGRYQMEFDGLTRALDRLPVIETEKISAFSIEGEIAQVLPNPNPLNNSATGDPNGVAFIDDFEGAKRTTSIPIQRRYWKEGSAPIVSETGKFYSQRKRAKLTWYNPYVQIRTKDIWPNQSTSIQAQNETTDILRLKYRPRTVQRNLPPDTVWAAITSPLYSGDYDQTQTKFFEIWLYGEKGKITFDLGRISEDRNGDGLLNTEDEKVGGMAGNTLLDEGEDIGLDGCTDEFEDGWGGCLDTFYVDVVDNPEWEDLVYTGSDRNLDDPNGDNWTYKEGSSDYSHINGTENNKRDGGSYPDTESLDRSNELIKKNDYFTKSLFLSDTTYLAGRTKKTNGELTGWKLYRIPLIHFLPLDSMMSNEWTEIRHIRLTVSDTGNVDINVAKIELVGNDWQELGISADTSNIFTKENSDSVFAISVVNTEDNANYTPPKGVRGEYDRINDIRSKEQSLVLKFQDLPARHSGAAIKSLMKISGANYLTYDKMKMYVYGETQNAWIGNDETNVNFFLRFGQGKNYYEIIQPVYSGWDESAGRNSIEVDLNWLTKLKLQDSSKVNKYQDTDIYEITDKERIYTFTDEKGIPTGKIVKIIGKPSLSSIQFFTVGITNNADEPITGEVWLDEMRLSGVKRDRGVAMRVQSQFNLADLISSTFSYSRKDADFHVLQQRLGSNTNTESFRLSLNTHLNKFLPKSWGISIPVNTSFSSTLRKPKYFPDSDILVNQDAIPDSILSRQRDISLSTSLSKSSKSDNKIIKATLDKIKPSFSVSQSKASNELNSEVLKENYSGKINYNYSFGRDNYISPFKWLKPVPWLGSKIEELHFYYTPSAFTAGMNFNESLTQTTKRLGGRIPDNYSFKLNRSFGLDYNLTDKLKTKYKRSISSDMQDYRGYVWSAIQQFDPGIVNNITENLNTSFNPQIFSWLKPNITHSAGYRWNKPRTSTVDGATIGTQLRFSSSVSILPSQIFEMVYKPPSKNTRQPQGRRRGRSRKPVAEEVKKKEQKDIPFLTSMHGIIKKINTINLTYTENLNRTSYGVQGNVPTGYKFGWLPEHGMTHDQTIGSNLGAWDHKRDFSVRSGLNLTRTISTSFNYSQKVSTTIGASNIEQRSMERDYLSWGDKLENGFPFFGWSVRWTGVEKWPLIKNIARTASLEHGMSGRNSRAWQFENIHVRKMPLFDLDPFISEFKDDQRSSRTNISFSPLIGLNMNLKKGISFNIRHTVSKSVQDELNGLSVRKEKSLTASSNYSHRGGFTIPLPMTDDWHIQNTVNFTLNFDMNESETLGSQDGGAEFGQLAFNSGWKTALRISYSFSSQITGGIIYEYRETDSKTTGRKIDRDFGFDVNIAISG
ncbi:MAG: cell surface protein SprA [Fidelibacterota bacterium]